MAQSAQEALESLRDDLAELEARVVALEKTAAEKKPVGGDEGLRGEFEALKAQLAARFGHSLE